MRSFHKLFAGLDSLAPGYACSTFQSRIMSSRTASDIQSCSRSRVGRATAFRTADCDDVQSTSPCGQDSLPALGRMLTPCGWLAKEVHNFTPQTPVDLDPNEVAYPAAFCTAPAGSYKIRAVLDVDHNFAYYDDASDGDLMGTISEQNFNPTGNERIALTLTERKTDPPLQLPPHTELFDFVSPISVRILGTSDPHEGCDCSFPRATAPVSFGIQPHT